MLSEGVAEVETSQKRDFSTRLCSVEMTYIFDMLSMLNFLTSLPITCLAYAIEQ